MARRKPGVKREEKPLGLEDGAPTPAQWAKMTTFYTFQVQDTNDEPNDFNQGSFAIVVPADHDIATKKPLYEEDHWFCQIEEIRAFPDETVTGDRVWVKIRWFYHPTDPALANAPGFDPHLCGHYERIKSNHTDCVSSTVFQATVDMISFDESNLEQEFIPPETYYYRYEADMNKKSRKANKSPPAPTLTPKPSATCVCLQPYDALDPSPGGVMHLCPQPTCRRYFHRECIEKNAVAGRSRREYLHHNPDTGTPILESPSSSASRPSAKRRKTSSASTSKAKKPVLDLSALPPRLVKAAAQPIVRGQGSGVGVAGNVRAVMTARRRVCNLLQGDDADEVEAHLMQEDGENENDSQLAWEQAMPDYWEDAMVDGWELDLEDDVEEGVHVNGHGKRGRRPSGAGPSKGKQSKGKVLFTLKCPTCGGPI
ncbi:BAH domain-containing protein [Mycena chlorophos]|uniref:BAH domain-containing protein n=1 Tax=Mycena chlorophos TaxID=658473 RepID=A0A8H6WJI8_MYCCL|nr:BAH domain-containing protein [Mycena chlorophos]